jgi:DNA replication and repair protein RecF
MSLLDLTVEDLRCLQRAELSLHPGRNLIWGANGAGKTSLLEAMFLLGRGRSFRTRQSERLIRRERDRLIVFGHSDSVPVGGIGVQVSKTGGTEAKVGGAFVRSLAELAQAFPVQIVDPGVHRLIEEGAAIRRRWLDWAVFHVEQGFVDNWVRYSRTLRQRNAALKSGAADFSVWNPELIRTGELLAESRRACLEALQPFWRDSVSALVGMEVELGYSRGWAQDRTFAEALAASADRDRSHGVTCSGPHRADVAIRVGGRLARDTLSRGQQKLVAVAMTLSQLELVRKVTGVVPTLLLDDPAAELDSERLAAFIERVERLNAQLIVTALSPDAGVFSPPDRVFHVEHGNVIAT